MRLKSLQTTLLRGALLVTLTVAAYAPALTAGFAWDDDDHVTQNETLRDASGLHRIWFERGAVPQYYPLVHTTFWVEYHLWGLDPTGYHLVNVLLHVVAALLLWRVLHILGIPGSYLAALLFALHPVAVESVAWITERKNVLSTVCYLAAALAWFRYRPDLVANPATAATKRPSGHSSGDRPESSRPIYYAASLSLFIGALLSKTVTASLPAALLLIGWWKRGRIRWSDVRPLIPFFAIGLLLALNTASMEQTRVGASGADWSFTWAERVLIAGRAVWFYASKLAWPANLTFIYPRWTMDARQLAQWLYPSGAAAVVVATWVLRHRIGRGPLVAVLFFGGTLLPALGFFNVYPMRFSFVADHFQYLAAIGLITLAAAGLHERLPRASLTIPLALAVLTWRQSHVYHDLETLWSDTIAKNEGAWLAYNNLGNVLLDRDRVDSAAVLYRNAVRLKPDYYEAHGNLAAALLRLGAVEDARTSVDAALRASPGYVPALVSRATILLRDGRPNEAIVVLQDVLRHEPANGEALNVMGSAFAARGDFANARAAFEAAVRVQPAFVAARVNLARTLLRAGEVTGAESQLAEALRHSPNDSDARNAKGMVLLARGQPAEAIAYFQDLARALPGDASARFNLGTLLSQAGRNDLAIEQFQSAIRLNPYHAEARNNLGIAYLITGRYAEAAEQFSEAIRLRRNNPEAHNNLAYALIRLGRTEDAVASLREAIALRPSYPEALAQLRALGRRP
jgi:protein O-mannosyl-transferase